jgi:hypothetical protein
MIYGTGISEADRLANAAELQTACVSGSVTLDAGVLEIQVADGDPVTVANNLTLSGAGKALTTVSVFPKAPTWTDCWAFNITGQRTITLADLTIAGVTSSTAPNPYQAIAVNWVASGTTGSSLTIERCAITNYGAPVVRSGGGTVILSETEFTNTSGDEVVFGFYESGNVVNPGSLTMDGCTLNGGHGGAALESVGLYIHPHIPYTITNSHFEGIGRFGVYGNGNPNRPASGTITDCTFTDCDLVQVDTNQTVTVTRCATSGVSTYVGSLLKGTVTFDDCEFLQDGWAATSNAVWHPDVTFTGCLFQGEQVASFLKGNTDAIWRFTDCTWNLVGNAYALFGTVDSSPTVEINGCEFNAPSPGQYVGTFRGGHVVVGTGNVVDTVRASVWTVNGGGADLSGFEWTTSDAPPEYDIHPTGRHLVEMNGLSIRLGGLPVSLYYEPTS